MSRRNLAPLCLVLSCSAAFAAGGPSSGPVAIKTPASQEVFKTLWIPYFVEFKGEPVVFALKAQDQYLVTLPYAAQADASKLPRTSSDAFESRLTWIAATTQMLVAVVKLPAGQWPTDGKAPVILAGSTLAIDQDCALKGMPLFDADKKGKPVASWKTGWQDESPYRVDYYNLKAPD
jgi:hypothetical protein